jgi:hypothetical protein
MKASSKKAALDEDIESESDNDELFFEANEKTKQKNGAISADIANDAFFDNETPEEKRLRMTKALLRELGEEKKEERDDFFVNLQANTTTDVNIMTAEDDDLKRALKYKILEQKDKLFYTINKQYGTPEAEYDR